MAIQVHRVMEQMARSTVVGMALLCGRVPFKSEQALLWDRGTFPPCSKADILVATPGKLVEHLDRQGIDY